MKVADASENPLEKAQCEGDVSQRKRRIFFNRRWTKGNFINRHHVEPREEPFPIPLKYIDVKRNASMIVGMSMGLETCQTS